MTNFQARWTKRMRRLHPTQIFARAVVKKREEEFQQMWRDFEAFRELHAFVKGLIAETDGKWDLQEMETLALASLRGRKQGLVEVLNYIESNVKEAMQDNVVPRTVVEDTADPRPETDTVESAPQPVKDTAAEVH